jgi:hypothetical protein
VQTTFEVINLRPIRQMAQRYGSLVLALPAVSKAATIIAAAYVNGMTHGLGPGLPAHWVKNTTDYVSVFIEKNWTPEHVLRVYYTIQAQMTAFGKLLWLPK